ncbi:GGDEF domain-containing response regulator [Dapis sp. BLCC M172]|uniref:GGDEF domain-containing response regulator n=1 Tax=Dapis sp. BLCC M172 TaxID=2975281 RepID=UPI003CE98D54
MKNFVASDFSILIVDYHPENLKLLGNVLVKAGYNLNFATNCQEARQKISHLHPNLILFDLKVAEDNGCGVCHQLQEDLKHQHIPMIFMTVNKERKYLNYNFELGVIDYLQKPFDYEEVLAKVKTHLIIKQKSDELKESEAKLNTIITHLYDGILIIDRHGVVKFANPAAARIFGQPLEALLNHSLGIPILTSDKALLDFIHPNGKLGVAEITVGKTEWQGETVDIICLRDVSDRQKVMEELEVALTKQKELSEELEKQATTDGLTNIYNRRQIMKLAAQEFDRSIRYQHPFSILMMDIDKFKIINDTYGHQIGDRVIIEMVKAVLKNIRKVDILGRLGGDEFMAILPETNQKQAVEVAERICLGMREIEITFEAEIIKVYTSIGVASYSEEIINLEDMISYADKALYQAKRGGRNQFCTV